MSSTTKWKRSVIDIGRKHAGPLGGNVRIEMGRHGHPQLIIEIGPRARSVSISSSTAHQSAALFAVERDVRRLVKEMTQ